MRPSLATVTPNAPSSWSTGKLVVTIPAFPKVSSSDPAGPRTMTSNAAVGASSLAEPVTGADVSTGAAAASAVSVRVPCVPPAGIVTGAALTPAGSPDTDTVTAPVNCWRASDTSTIALAPGSSATD